jgi:DNA-binding MarR family transcriptional regulator
MDFLTELGSMAIASRLRRLTERFSQDAVVLFKELNLEFEPRWFPVFYLLTLQKPMGIVDIAKVLGISHPAVNQIAGEMIQKGFLIAFKDDKDRRKRYLTLSDKGRAWVPLMERIWDGMRTTTALMMEESGVDVMQAVNALEGVLLQRGLRERFLDLKLDLTPPDLTESTESSHTTPVGETTAKARQ